MLETTRVVVDGRVVQSDGKTEHAQRLVVLDPFTLVLLGHSDVAFTMKRYVQTDLEVHRQVATTLAELILGGVLLSGVTAADASGERPHEAPGAHTP